MPHENEAQTTAAAPLRLLVPVDGAKGALAGAHYAARRCAENREAAVCLLHVEEPDSQWGMLRAANAHGAPQHRHAEDALAAVSQWLAAQGIPATSHWRSGTVVFTILDMAEQLECDEIAVPRPIFGWHRFFSRNIVAALLARQRGIPIVVVDAVGIALSEQSRR